MRDICEGLRVVILGEKPSQVPRSMRRSEPLEERHDANKDETIKVYSTYRELLDMGDGGEGAEYSNEEDPLENSANDEDDRNEASRFSEPWSSKGLAPASWSALFMWAQNKEDFANDFRSRSVCAALNRAIKDLYEAQRHMGVDLAQSGVPLGLLFQWIWPSVTHDHIVEMLKWVCLEELKKIRQPTPRVIETAEKRVLEKLFRTMDPDDKGSVTPEDLAGGRDQGIDAKLKNIVDKDTVIAVCGDESIKPMEFLELMCEDNFRAHKNAMHIIKDDGRRLVRQKREVLGIDIWVLEDVPKVSVPNATMDSESQRRLVDAIEAEIRRWRRRAEVRRESLRTADLVL